MDKFVMLGQNLKIDKGIKKKFIISYSASITEFKNSMASAFFIFGSAEKNSLYKHVIYIKTAYAKIVKFMLYFLQKKKLQSRSY